MISELTNHLWQSTLFAIVAGLLAVALRKNRAEVRYWLWFSASLKFFIPFSLLINLGSHLDSVQAAHKVTQIATQIATPSVSFTMEKITEPFPNVSRSAPFTSRATVEWRPQLIIFLWMCGFGAIALIRLRTWRLIRAAVRASTPVEIPSVAIPTNTQVCLAPGLLEPGVVGLRRPTLLLPTGILTRLTPRQLEAVVAHELYHIKRRDNITSAIHMVAEALFWFHPLIWWIGARLIQERERACDEEVLRLGNEPQIYAEGILNVCKFYKESPLVCVSGVTGSNLKKRIEDIMKNRIGVRLGPGRKALLAVAAMAVLAGPISIGIVQAAAGHAQSGRTVRTLIEPIAIQRDHAAPVEIAKAQTPQQTSRTTLQNPVQQQAAFEIASSRPTSPMPVAPVVLQATDVRGQWTIESPARGPSNEPFAGRLQLSFYSLDVDIPITGRGWGNGGTSKSFVFDPSVFRGLTAAQIDSPVRTPARFDFVTEAGTFVCDGYFESGHGIGSFAFHSDPAYLGQMAALGLPNIPNDHLVAMALTGIGPRFLRDLRSMGLALPTFNDLMGMWGVGVTGEYIRDIQRAGYTPNGNDLIAMRALGVTPEFASEVRQMYPSASANDLVGMQANGLSIDYMREMRQMYPSASINDLVGARVNGVSINFAREVQRRYPSASINELVGIRIYGDRR
jgi:beta-lactamase regulating signal transducer with metallopeptidase domain